MGLLDMPAGYTGQTLTPDQQTMLQQQGWFPNADMSLPTGVPNTQPTGYTGLTPAQVATQQGLGYYTGQAQKQQSLWDKLSATLGSPDLQKALQGIGAATTTQRPSAMPMPPPFSGAGINYGAYKNPYLARMPSLNPATALQQLRGY